MYIDPNWRILTIGDGDLSFSYSLCEHHQVKQLTATVFDDFDTLNAKYQDNYLSPLLTKKCKILTGFDVTKPQTWGMLAEQTAQQQYDLVIFQFPLLPAFSSINDYQQQCQKRSVNTLNRRLLRDYLQHCFQCFLDPKGQQLAYITSKDVKPYRQWHIETALTLKTDICFIGTMDFNIAEFPAYKIRNVDRDKHVKDTEGLTYVFTLNNNQENIVGKHVLSKNLKAPLLLDENYCQLCRVGPFLSEFDKSAHKQTKKHQQQLVFAQQWLDEIAREDKVKV